MLVDHADSGAHRVTGSGEMLDGVVEQDLALVGLVEAVEHVHEGGLAGAVLSEKGVDLTGFDREVDVVVRDQGTERLCDATELELHFFNLLALGFRGI